MHYVAWLIGQGAVPYRDVFDMNLPGVYALHAMVLTTLGPGDLGWRLFDLGWLLATATLLFAYCRPLAGPVGGAATALLFSLYHLAGGAWRAGQRDYLLCALLILGVWGVALSWESADALWPLAGAGLVLGAAVTLKPHATLFLAAAAAIVAVGRRRAERSWVAGVGLVLGAGLVAPALVIGWLAWRGGLRAFISVLADYVLPLYGSVDRVNPWRALLFWHVYGWQIFSLLSILAVAGAILSRRPFPIRAGLAVVGAGYGAVHFVGQGKGWEYHLYPLACFLCLLAGAAVGAAASGRLTLGPRVAVASLLAATVIVMGAKGADASRAPWIVAKERTVTALAEDLRALPSRGQTVQVMDTTAGGIHALFRLGLRQPTRFMYDFHFFHDESDPRIQALRAEFARGLALGRPAAIVVMRDSWPALSYDRLARFPEVERLLADRYTLAREGDGYRIYAKRSDS